MTARQAKSFSSRKARASRPVRCPGHFRPNSGIARLEPSHHAERPSIVLDRLPATDTEGYAGLEDQVDNHWGMVFKAAILSTILSVGSEAGMSANNNSSLAEAIQQGMSQSINQAGERVVSRSLNIQPTITIRPGFPVRVLVTRDLVLEPYRG